MTLSNAKSPAHCGHECNGDCCHKYRANFYQQKGEPCICTKCMDDTRRQQTQQPAALAGIRPEVIAFAKLMEETLRKNDYKGHWKDCSFTYLFEKLDEEREELDREVSRQRSNYDRIIAESVDEANILMMICGNLTAIRQRTEQEERK